LYANYKYHPKFDLLNISLLDNPTAKDLTLRLLKPQKKYEASSTRSSRSLQNINNHVA